MNIPAFNRAAHHSSFAFSCLLNLLLVLLIVRLSTSGPVEDPPAARVRWRETQDPVEVTPPAPDLPDDPYTHTDGKWTETACGMPGPIPPSFVDPGTVDAVTPVFAPLPKMDVGVSIRLPPTLGDRGDEEKKIAVKKYLPGSVAELSEPAVIRALDWLQACQHPNGAWSKTGEGGGGVNSGYTGLALLSFLAHGETPASEKYGVTVARAIRYLVDNQDSRGVFRPAGPHTAYGHAIATYAMAEAYLMTGNPLLRDPLARGVRVILDGQMPGGGFDYEYKQESRNDLSLGAWHVQALKAVSLTDLADAELHQQLQQAMDALLAGSKTLKDDSRGFTYTVTGGEVGAPRRIISAAGTLGLFLSGRKERKETRESLKFLSRFCESDRLPRWGDPEVEAEHGGEIMFWYYMVQALFHDDPHGRSFTAFVTPMVRELVQHQAADGHWAGYTERGIHQGPVFNTALGALSLMTPYRYSLGSPVLRKREVKEKVEVVFEI